MVLNDITLKPQECTGNYNFSCRPVFTRGFLQQFGDDAVKLALMALKLVNNTYKDPDRLQVLTYQGNTFWILADFERGAKAEDYEDIQYLYVTFLLPDEY